MGFFLGFLGCIGLWCCLGTALAISKNRDEQVVIVKEYYINVQDFDQEPVVPEIESSNADEPIVVNATIVEQ